MLLPGKSTSPRQAGMSDESCYFAALKHFDPSTVLRALGIANQASAKGVSTGSASLGTSFKTGGL